jgi:hypothetical protein
MQPFAENAWRQPLPDRPAEEPGTFKTDMSETADEGTTVREAEVRESDLSEKGLPRSGDNA